MRTIGAIVLVVGCICLWAASDMDTSVSGPNGRVHNTGLIQEQTIRVIWASLGVLCGIILIGLGGVCEVLKRHDTLPRCSDCKGSVRPGARRCPHCESPLEWVDGKPMLHHQALEAQIAKQDAWERKADELGRRREQDAERLARRLEVAIEAGTAVSAVSRTAWYQLLTVPARANAALVKWIGEENTILLMFVRGLLIAAISAAGTLLALRVLAK